MIEFSGATTALWLAFKWSVQTGYQNFQLDRPTWESAMFELETRCSYCTKKPASDVFAMIASGSSYVSLNINPAVLVTPPVMIASSSPQTVGWTAPTSIQLAAKRDNLAHHFDSTTIGNWAFTAAATPPGRNTVTLAFPYVITSINHTPVATSNNNYILKANHNSIIDLAALATDSDGDTLTFTFNSAPPTGLAFTAPGASTIAWNPVMSAGATNQVGTWTLPLTASDNRGGVIPLTLYLQVNPDVMPVFNSVPAGGALNLTEEVSSNLIFQVTDTDGDPVVISCTTASCGPVPIPTGFTFEAAGWGATPFVSAGVPPAMQTITVPFKPSYLQAVGVVSVSRTLNWVACYDIVARPDLRDICTVTGTPLTTGTSPSSANITVTITNVDDPPVWGVQPVNQAVTENTLTSFTGPTATDAAVYNPTPLTFSVAPGSLSPNCSWLQVATIAGPAPKIWSGGAVIPYASGGTCSFQVRATDAAGLYTDSAVTTYTVADVVRGPTPSGVIPGQTLTEASPYTLNLATYFTDLDLAASDPRSAPIYTCTNCDALGVSSVGGSPYSINAAGMFSWTPPYSVSGPGSIAINGLTFQISDRGQTATQNANFTVNNTIGPLVISYPGGSSITMNGGASASATVQISNTPGDNSSYAWTITSACVPTCAFATLTATTGTGPGSVTLNLNPAAGSNNRVFSLTLTVTDNALPAVNKSQTINFSINNML